MAYQYWVIIYVYDVNVGGHSNLHEVKYIIGFLGKYINHQAMIW